jgi:hypothetical protein
MLFGLTPATATVEAAMKVVISGLLGLSLLAGLAGAADAAPRYKKYRYSTTQDGNGYREHLADKLPIGSSDWWRQMDRERRGGRPG